MNIMFSFYFALYLNFDTKTKKDKFLDILEEINPEFKNKLNEDDLNSKEPFILDNSTNTLKSKWTELEIKSGTIKNDTEYNLCFIKPFNKLLNYIHASLALNIPLILEGQIGIGKKTAINYISEILGKKVIYFSISNTTTVEDLFCKTKPEQNESSIEFKTSRSKLLDAIDSSKYKDESLNNCIIIIDNLQQSSSNVLEALIPVFDETKKTIFLPNGDTINKGNYNLIAIFDPTCKGNNIKNALPNSIKYSSLLYKCENYINEKYLMEISDTIFDYKEENDTKYQKKFIKDLLVIFKYCQENQSKELFTLNDLIKYQKIYEITLKKNIIDYETLLQILLIYRFSNIDDINNITKILKYPIDRDLWPSIDYTDEKDDDDDDKDKENSISEDKNKGYYIRISPMEKKRYLSHKLRKFDVYYMENLKKKMFSLTPEQRLGLIFLMISLRTNLTCIIQGPTASGKSYLIKLFCELLGEEPEIIELNNDSGISLLTGQIAPKSDLDDEDIIKIQKLFKKCKINDKLYSIVNKNDFIENPKKWKPYHFREILKELELIKKDLNEQELKLVKRIESKLNNELSFLKHLKNQDSPFINALIKGKWVILDGIESAQPELFERLISLCDITNKNLNLFEKGPEYEYTINNENPDYRINENFRLFITYNPVEIDQSKKLTSSFISKCLTFFLQPIDKDDKSSALILSGLFNYNKIFEENEDKKEIIHENIVDNDECPKDTKTEKNIKKLKEGLAKKKNGSKEKGKKSRSSSSSSGKKSKHDDKKSRSSSSSSKKSKHEDKKSRSSSSSSKKSKKEDKKSRSSSSSSKKSKKGENKDNNETITIEDKLKKENEKNIIDEKLLEEKRIKSLSIKRFIRELSIRLSNMHLSSKNFAKDKLSLFAGQKNFSGRTLKYIYNTIVSRKNNLPESIISVMEDCYCNSYKEPEKMKEFLIGLFNKKSENYNEVMSYLRRDEVDAREKYEPLYKYIDDYLNDQKTPFKINVFLDYFDEILYKDINELRKNIEQVIISLEAKDNIGENYIFFRILFNILNSFILIDESEKLKEKKCLEKKITDPIISKKLLSIKFGQNKYLLIRHLIKNNFINLNVRYKKYNDYEIDIKNNEDIKNPYFELFTEKGNLISNSVTLSLLYPEIVEDNNFDDKIKLNQTQIDIVMIIIKLINFSEINKENIKEHFELNILQKLISLLDNNIFNDAMEEIYKIDSLDKIVSDKMVNESNKIMSILNSLTEENLLLDEDNLNYIQKKFDNWYKKYEEFNEDLIKANYIRQGKEEEGQIKESFKKLIKKLRGLDEKGNDDFIKRAIKYLEKTKLSLTSLKNSEKYVDNIIDEYKNIKSEEGKKKALIKFDIKPGDYIDNYEPIGKFQKVIKSLIEYTDCMNLVEEIKKKNRIMHNFNKLDKIINNIKGKNILKKSFKILRKNLIEDEKDEEKSISYFKDILLSKFLQEIIQIDEFYQYLHIEKIIFDFNRYKERESVNDDERKYASYLATLLDPTYEIILPTINLNSILLLFVQKTYKGKTKPGLFFSGTGKNLFIEGKEEFFKQIEEFQKSDLTKINLIDGLDKLVDICKNTIFETDKQIKPLLEEGFDKKKLINYINDKDKTIKLKDIAIKSMISIIKNLYDSCDNFGFSKGALESNILNIDESIPIHDTFIFDKSEEKDEKDEYGHSSFENTTILNFNDKLEFDDLFFIYDSNWKENINNKNSKHRYLIYYLFKNPQIEIALRNNLLETETFNDKEKINLNKFPIYVHLLRIFSTKNELSFQGKSKTYTSNIIEKFLVTKIKNKPKKYFINNIAWIGLLINNALTISNKFIPNKISYLYHYLCKLSEIQFVPSSEFESKYKNIIETLINFIIDSCFNNNIEDIFNLKIIKFEEDLLSNKEKKSSKKILKIPEYLSKDKTMTKELYDLIEDIKFVKKTKIIKKDKKKINKKMELDEEKKIDREIEEEEMDEGEIEVDKGKIEDIEKVKGKKYKLEEDEDEDKDKLKKEEKIEKDVKEGKRKLKSDEEKEDEEEGLLEEEDEDVEEKEKKEKYKMENKINNIHYLVHLNEIATNELEEKEKQGYAIFDKKLRNLSTDIEPSKNKLSEIYDELIEAIKKEIREEKEKRQAKEIEDANKKIFGECEDLQNDIDRYISKYGRIKEELPKDMFNKEIEDLLSLQEKLRLRYGKDIFEKKEIIKVLEINIPLKYLIDEVKIIPNEISGLDIMILGKENLEKRKYYLPYKYYKSEMVIQKYDDKKKEKKTDKINLKEFQEIKSINEEKIKKIKLDIQNKKEDIKLKDIKDIEVKLLISDTPINIEIKKDKFLLKIQEIAKKIAKFMKKISEHLTEKDYIIEKMEKIKEIIDEFSGVSLNDPKFIDGVTELINTKKIFEEFQTLKTILIKKFELIRENYLNYKKIKEEFKNDKKCISSSYKLSNNIKTVDKKIDISSFKENNFNSPYIMLSPDNKTIQTSYPIFNFKLNSIIPSLFGNSIFSVNIFSFVTTKNLKAQIIENDKIDKEYSNLFFVPNYIPASNPIVISFIIPEKKIEKEEIIELKPSIKLSGSTPDDINSLIINTKFFIQFLPLRVIVFSDKLSFTWKRDRLIIDKEYLKQGHSLKINFKILNFNGNYEFLENNYSINSLDDNSVDMPIIKLDKEEKSSAKFKIDIPISENISEKICHGLFSVYLSNNLIIPIEIKSKIKKNDFELFYFDKYMGKIQNHNNNKVINIYKYYLNKDIKFHLYFHIEYNDKEEHDLIINVPAYNTLLSFEAGMRETKIKEGKTIDIKINIANFNTQKEYYELKKICSEKLEIEFIGDKISKKFQLNIQVERFFAQYYVDWLNSVPFFIYNNNSLIKVDQSNFSYFFRKNKYFLYHDYNFNYDIIVHDENYNKFSPILSKLIFIIKDFYKDKFIIWGLCDDSSKLDDFIESYINGYSRENIKIAENEISEIYSKFNYIFTTKYEDIKKKEIKYSEVIEKMQELIVYICSNYVIKDSKYKLLNELVKYISKDEFLIEIIIKYKPDMMKYFSKVDNLVQEIEKMKLENNENNLTIIYHNIIFMLGNIFKKRRKLIKLFEGNYYKLFAFCENLEFIKDYKFEYNEKEFEAGIKSLLNKNIEDEGFKDYSSKIWEFDEFSKEEPKKLKEIPNEEIKKEEKEGEIISEELKINEDILKNNKIDLNKVGTINEISELLKSSSILAQLFPFLIGKINENEIIKLFNNLYSIYISYKKYDKSILSEDSIKYCKLFEKICINLIKYKVNLDEFEEIKKLSSKSEDVEFKAMDLIDYPKPRILNITKESKWFKSNKDKSRYEKIIWEARLEKVEDGEIHIKEKIDKKETFKPTKLDKNMKSMHKKETEITVVKTEEEKEEIDEIIDIKDIDSEEENEFIYEKETDIIKEVLPEKMRIFKDDKNLTKYIINLMIKNKKSELRIPELLEDNGLKEEYFSHTLLSDDKKNPAQLLLELSNVLSFKLLQASIKQNTESEKICAVIAIDCCRTIEKMRKFYHTILAFGMINCLNAMEIPYSLVIFADYQFLYTIKRFETEHDDSIYKTILDCIMVPRYSSRIADACYYIDKKVFHPNRTNRRIFIISNGLDPKLKSPEQWGPFFENEKDKYCFYFLKPEMEEEQSEIIKNIWETFKKETGIEVEVIDDMNDIINGEENVYSRFSYVLSEKVIISEEEKSKLPINLNNIEGKFYDPKYKEKYDLDQKSLSNVIEYLKFSIDDQDFYLKNNQHTPSNINKIKEREISLIHPFLVRLINLSPLIDEKELDKLSRFENKGVLLDLVDMIFPPNKPSMYAPSVKGTRLYLVGLVKFIITGGQDNKIWLEKKAGLKRDYRVSVIIDSSKSCFNNINSFHSFKTVFSFLKCLSLIEIPYFDLIIATDKEPIVLCLGNDTTNSLNNKSKIWQAIASQLYDNNYYKCNIKDCLLLILKLKSLNLSKKSFTFVLTDGLFNKEDQDCLYDLISYVEENYISVYGIGLGLYPEGLEKIFTKCIWSSNPNNLLKALSVFFGNDISHVNTFTIKPKISDSVTKLKYLSEINENYGDYITYQKLSAFLEDRPFSLESMEETVNRDEADKIDKNPEIDESNTMCKPGSFKGLKALCCCFWSKAIAGKDESDWIDPQYLLKRYSSSCGHCLKDAFDYYGIELIVKTNYDECIMELQKGGKYYAAWIICGDGGGKIPGGGKANIVGQFIEALIRFWMNGGALLFWCDNYPLTYEANLFLQKAEFPGDNPKSNIRFVGNHLGQKEMKGGNIRLSKSGIFNEKRQFEEGKIKRYSLGHNLKKIFEGTTVSFAKIKNSDMDIDEDDLKEENLEDPSIETLLPFVAFSYDHEEGLSVIFYPSGDGDNRGDIIIDGGFSKLFNEIDKTGTYRYVLNSIAWTTQFSRRTVENGDCWVEAFNLASFKYDINYDAHWIHRPSISNEFDIVYLIDATGSMSGEINAAKNQVINILNDLKSKYPTMNFNFGAIFYRDKIDSPSDKNDFFPLTDNMETLRSQISTVKAYGGGDGPEDWVEGYKLATNNIAWREGTKLIIHIADDGAHGTEFSSGDRHPEQGPLLPPLIKKCVEKNIKIIGFKIGNSPSNSFNQIKKIYDLHKSSSKAEGVLLFDIYDFKRGSAEEVSKHFKDLVIKAAVVAAPKFK